MTYGVLAHFESVSAARAAWEGTRQHLVRVSDLCTALGLAGPQSGRSPLDIPKGFSTSQAAGRMEELLKIYPRHDVEFTLADLPEAVLVDIRQAARSRYQHLLEAGRAVVLQHLMDLSPGDEESPESWKRLLFWLAKPEDLSSWRVLATVLNRLSSPDGGGDPIISLEAFLRKERFELRVSGLDLRLPDNLALSPGGPLTVHFRNATGEASSFAFQLRGEGRRDADLPMTDYWFQPADPLALTYMPGDALWIDLQVTKAKQPGWRLTWAANRSTMYQFERFAGAPRLHRENQENLQGELIEGAALKNTPQGGIPPVPDLLPALPARFERK
jgi:hypothetical protein